MSIYCTARLFTTNKSILRTTVDHKLSCSLMLKCPFDAFNQLSLMAWNIYRYRCYSQCISHCLVHEQNKGLNWSMTHSNGHAYTVQSGIYGVFGQDEWVHKWTSKELITQIALSPSFCLCSSCRKDRSESWKQSGKRGARSERKGRFSCDRPTDRRTFRATFLFLTFFLFQSSLSRCTRKTLLPCTLWHILLFSAQQQRHVQLTSTNKEGKKSRNFFLLPYLLGKKREINSPVSSKVPALSLSNEPRRWVKYKVRKQLAFKTSGPFIMRRVSVFEK